MAKIDIKGVNKSLVFVFSNGSVEEYAALLKNRFENNQQLFKGSPVIFQGTGLEQLSHDDVAALQRLCLDYGMIMHNVHTPVRELKTAGEDLFIYRTLRSGQNLHSEGSMIIWGDVHESAEVTAAKDVIVLGKLEGIAHAGCYGDVSSTIFALDLSPKQLRIGDKISRASGEYIKNPVPCIAYTEGANICIKEYRP
ncbi:MAG: septum site-determining protein MinC [Syntrophomonas sp.]|nr:septum site-determining protein MinC [Syntrophomonas sp.]